MRVTNWTCRLGVVVAIISLPGLCWAQLQYTANEADVKWSGRYAGSQLGYSVAVGGDVNEDGRDDLILGAIEGGTQCFFDDDGNLSCDGLVIVARGDTGELLFQIEGPSNSSDTPNAFGASVAIGLFDGDDASDILIGSPLADSFGLKSGRAYVYSGDSASLYEYVDCDRKAGDQCGRSVASRCDVNGDDVEDFLVSSNSALFVYDGGSFALEKRIDYEGLTLGESLSCLGDINNDGVEDFASSSSASQSLRVYYGGGFETAGELSSSIANDGFGSSIAQIGDWDGDGQDDFAVGVAGAGLVHIYSGRFELLNEIKNPLESCSECRFGKTVSGLGDINLDGTPDILIGDPSWNGSIGQAYVYSGKTSNLLFAIRGESPADDFSWACHSYAKGFDANGDDGTADFICTAAKNDDNGVDAGKSYLFYSPHTLPVPWLDVATPPASDDEPDLSVCTEKDDEIAALQSQLTDLNAIRDLLEDEIALLQLNLNSSEEALKTCLDENAELQKQNSQLIGHNEELLTQVNQLKVRIAELEKNKGYWYKLRQYLWNWWKRKLQWLYDRRTLKKRYKYR